jgi:hypothetical protein
MPSTHQCPGAPVGRIVRVVRPDHGKSGIVDKNDWLYQLQRTGSRRGMERQAVPAANVHAAKDARAAKGEAE